MHLRCYIFNAHDSNGIAEHGYCEDKSMEHIKHSFNLPTSFFSTSRWVYTIEVNLVKVGQTLTKMLFTLWKLFKVFNCSFKIWWEILITLSYFQDMDPINEQCFAFVICILCYRLSGSWGQGKCIFGQGTGCVTFHKVVHMLFHCKNLIGMNIKIFYADTSEFPAKCLCAFVCIYPCYWILTGWFLSKLVKVWPEIGIISICVKVGQTLTKSVKVVFTLSKFLNRSPSKWFGQILTKLTLIV